ncbi:MAG: hypothetical protein WA952_00025 [Lewinella sp.]
MKNLLTALVVFLSSIAMAQDVYASVDVSDTDPETPAPAAKTTRAAATELSDEDYKLMEYVHFLQDSPAKKLPGKRRQAANYLGWYLNKTTEITLTLDDKMPFLQYGESVPMFMAGYIEFVVAHPVPNPDKANLAGIRSVIADYKDNKEVLGKDELLEKLVELDDKGRLPAYIKRKLG